MVQTRDDLKPTPNWLEQGDRGIYLKPCATSADLGVQNGHRYFPRKKKSNNIYYYTTTIK